MEQFEFVTIAPGQPRFVALNRNELEVIGIHLGNEQRHIGVHAIVARVAEHETAGAREGSLDLLRHIGVERGENDGRVYGGGVAAGDREIRDALRQLTAQPMRRLAVALAGGALRGCDRGDVEPRMVREQADERLADGAGGAEYADGNPASGSNGGSHEASNVRTRRM